MDIEKLLKNFKSMEFDFIKFEFEYLDSTIKTLIKNYNKDFQEEDEKYQQNIEKLKNDGLYNEPIDDEYAPNMTHGEMLESIELQQPFHELESFANIIIESLLIKHLAYIEDIIIKLSFMIQKEEKQIIPPDYNISGIFTDIHKAVDYIEKVTNNKIRIKFTKNWAIITHLRSLRNELAHGKRNLILKSGVIDEINKKLKLVYKDTMVIKKYDSSKGLAENYVDWENKYAKDPKAEWNCKIVSDINVLNDINKICVEFIDEVKKLFDICYN